MASGIRLRMGAGDWAALIAVAILWGGGFFLTHVALTAVAPFTLVLVRVAIAAAMLLALLGATGRALPFERRTLIPFLTLALINNALPHSLFAWGQQHVAAGLASILNAATPLWTVFAAHLFTADEKAAPLKVAGAAIGFAGVAVMIGGDSLLALGGAGLLPQLACVAGALCATALIMLPFALVFDRPWRAAPPPADAAAAILALALVTALAYILFLRLIDRAGATNAILVFFLMPVTAILLDAILLGDLLAPTHVLGMALIALGLAAIDGRLLSRRRPRQAA
jgi:drug/metabolite transporter (DMT)-like permease